jgi:NADP-dependent 3-hydroxy acid dehydrogenase YdfG
MALATAQAFAEVGVAVVLADFKEDAVKTAAQKLPAAGRQLAPPLVSGQLFRNTREDDFRTIVRKYPKPSRDHSLRNPGSPTGASPDKCW